MCTYPNSNNILLSSAEDGKSVLHGVTSWGMGCAIPTFPGGVFAKVYALRNFVKNIIVRSDNYNNKEICNMNFR